MGWKYEVETYFYETDKWKTGYRGDSLYKAVRGILHHKKKYPGRAYRLVLR